MSSLILASQSPQRSLLLSQIGVKHEIIPSKIPETILKGESPRDFVSRIAQLKALKVKESHSSRYILSADTIVTVGRSIIPKTITRKDAKSAIKRLSGQRHRVLSSVCLASPDSSISQKLVTSVVAFKRLSEDEIEQYLSTNDWKNKAGGYAIQGFASRYIRFISGSYSCIVGLPLFETSQLLRGKGII